MWTLEKRDFYEIHDTVPGSIHSIIHKHYYHQYCYLFLSWKLLVKEWVHTTAHTEQMYYINITSILFVASEINVRRWNLPRPVAARRAYELHTSNKITKRSAITSLRGVSSCCGWCFIFIGSISVRFPLEDIWQIYGVVRLVEIIFRCDPIAGKLV